MEDVEKIIEHYKADQKVLVNKAYLLENDSIKNYQREIALHQQEIREMEFLLENVSKAKDVLAIENDKQKLKDLDAAVKNIKHRQKYSQTPSEIYDEIEISLGTMDVSKALYEEPTVTEEVVEPEVKPVLEEEVINELPIEETENVEEIVTDEPTEVTTEEVVEEPVSEEIMEENPFVIGEYDVSSEEGTNLNNNEENKE